MKKQVSIAVACFLLLVAGAVVMVVTGPKPKVRPPTEFIHSVNVLKMEEIAIQPRVIGYGEAAPDRIWVAITQISGRIVWMSPKLKNGEFVKESEELLRIDEREYKLAVRKSEANIKKIEASLKEKETLEKNLARRCELLREVLSLNEKSLERQKKLLSSNAASASTVETEEVAILQQRNTIANIESEMNLVPTQKASLEAELRVAQVAMEQAQLNLTFTKIAAPFAGRVDSVNAEIEQYASVGSTLFKIDSTARAEITTSLSVDQLAILMGARPAEVVKEAVDSNMPPPQVPAPRKPRGPEKIVVRTGQDKDFSWEGQFMRFGSSIDPTTRMVPMVVAVDDPYKIRNRSGHIPLSKGLFCQVEFWGRPRNAIVIPRNAIHGNLLYLTNADSRLEMRSVKVKYTLDQYAVLENGIRPGETLVLSDIVPAVAGMKIKAVPQEGFYEEVRKKIGVEKQETKR